MYGDRHRTRQLVTAGLVGLLVCVGVGVAIGRATVSSSGTTAPSHSAPAPTQAASPGPARVVNGVPVGYTHTQQGAVAAATNFARVLASTPLLVQPDALRTAYATVATPAQAEAFRRMADQAIAVFNNRLQLVTNAARGAPTAVQAYPLTYTVRSYAPAQATVDVWAVTVIAQQGTTVPLSIWGSTTFQLQWVNGDWRVASFADDQNGLQPQLLPFATTDTSQDVPPEISTYQGYANVPR